MPPCQRNDQTQYQPRSPYETPTCKILVGEAEAMFLVNEGFLQGTSFFAKHGPPRRHNAGNLDRQRSPIVEHTGPNLFFRENIPQMANNDEKDEEDPIDLTDTDADYELKGQFFYCRNAFALFIRHLHNAELEMPSDQIGCQSLFQAYALAETYNVELLQNAILQKLQMYYKEYTIPITDLIYVISHWPANIENNLLSYLMAQVGFEMAANSADYLSTNKEIEQLFSSNNPLLIERLFQAVLQHARPDKSADPSKAKRRWQHNLS